MALAKEPTSQDHSRIGSIQACSLYGNFLGAESSSAHQVSDLSCSGIYRFDHEHHQKMVHDQTGDSTEKASVFVKNLSMVDDTKGYVFEATNFHPEEAHESLINFKAAGEHDTFVHSTRSAGSSNLLSFVQNEPAPDQESYSKTSDHDQDEYSSLWPESDTNNYFVSKCNDSNGSRLLESFNSYQTASSTYGPMMSNNNNTVRENQHGDQEIFGLFFNEAIATIDSNTIQETGTQVAGYNKRHADMGESMQALKKQCTGAITKKPKAKIVTSKDPQSIAAKNRRERISERLKVLQELVPNGTKVDLVTMLEKAISYVKFLQLQVKVLATDDFWPAQGGKAPEISQVKEAIDAILLSQRDRN